MAYARVLSLCSGSNTLADCNHMPAAAADPGSITAARAGAPVSQAKRRVPGHQSVLLDAQ